ncbi:MAG: DUF1566 domain-containing protein, partial [Myxococcaceae bacterium]
AYCDTLNLGGGMWRLPKIKELQSIAGVGNTPAIDNTSFVMPAVQQGQSEPWFWSNSVCYFGALRGSCVLGASTGQTTLSATISSGTGVNNVRCVGCSTQAPPSAGLLVRWSRNGGTFDSVDNGRYTVSSGVVTDALTDLQWEQAASINTMAWSDAGTYCAGRSTGGFSNWRLPNIGELQTLIDYTVAYPAVPINEAYFPNTAATDFWSSTLRTGDEGNAWQVYFSDRGWSGYSSLATKNSVRCIRSCYQQQVNSRYAIASGEVRDTVTGLTWQQASTSGAVSYTNALQYCSSLSLNGRSWRLPEVAELSTLLNYGASYTGLLMDASVFAGEPAQTFWSSTPLAPGGSNPTIWIVEFGGVGVGEWGRVEWADPTAASARYNVRCVY